MAWLQAVCAIKLVIDTSPDTLTVELKNGKTQETTIENIDNDKTCIHIKEIKDNKIIREEYTVQ